MTCLHKPALRTAGLLIISFFIISNPSLGDDLRLNGRLGLETGYDDNICFVPDTYAPDRDWFQTISAGLSFGHKTHRLEDHIEADLKQYLYLETNDLNTMDSHAKADIAYTVTERLWAEARAAYNKDSTIALDLTEGQNPAASAHRTATALTGLKYVIARNLTADLSANYQGTEYENSAYTDNFSGGLSFGMKWRADAFLPRTLLGLQAGYSDYRYRASALKQADYKSLQCSADFNATERLRFGISLGGALTNAYYEYTFPVDYGTYTQEDITSHNSVVGSLNAAYIGEEWSIALLGSHNIDMASGAGSIVQRTSAGLNVSADFTPKISGMLQMTYTGYHSSKDDESANTVDQDTLYVRPVLKYRFADHFALNASYTWTLCENYDSDLTYRRNVACIAIETDYPFIK